MNKFLIIFLLVIFSFTFSSCSKDDPISPTQNVGLTNEEWQQIIESDSLIAITADSILLLQNPQIGWQQMINIYSSYPMVESVDVHSNQLIIKFKKGGRKIWYKPVPYTPLEFSKNILVNNNLNSQNKNDNIVTDSICILFNNYWDVTYWNLQIDINIAKLILENAGFKVNLINGAEANVNYYKNSLKGYRHIHILGHGAYCGTDPNPMEKGDVWMQTGEEGNMEYVQNNYSNDFQAMRVVSLAVPWGYGLLIKEFVTITDKFYDYYFQANDFINSMIYFSCCETFKGIQNQFPEILISKGFNAIVGWDNINCTGWISGLHLIAFMSYGNNLGVAYQLLPDGEKHNLNCWGNNANLVYFPFPGAESYMLASNPSNHPPNPPSNPSLANGATNQQTSLTLGWTCTDPDPGDILRYDVYLQDVNPPTNMVSQNQSNTNYQISSLQNNKTYYWKIVAKDNHNASTSGPVWSFSTSGTSSNVILPLEVGNWWKYYDDYGLFQDTSRLYISGTTNINNNTCYNWQWVGSTTKWYLKNQSDGCWCFGAYYNGGNLSGNPDLMLKYPASVGEYWVSNWLVLNQTTTVYCQSTNETYSNYTGCYKYYHTVTADADRLPVLFSCNEVKNKIKEYIKTHKKDGQYTYKYYYYFKPNVGYVGLEVYVDNTFVWNKTCTDYHLN